MEHSIDPRPPALAGLTPAEASALAGAVDRAASLVQPGLDAVEALLGELMQSPVGPIPAVGEHILSSGGKRLRPLLTLLAAAAGGFADPAAVPLACVGELIHTATLLHDDVVDEGDVRRGRPSARIVHGNGIAVLVGDYCLARSLETVARHGGIVAVTSLARTVTEMAQGEVAQLQHAGNTNLGVDDYYAIIDRKTATLVSWCCTVGELLPAKTVEALAIYGRELGRAFQIADDLLDCAGDPHQTGKLPGQDLHDGKLTLPVIYACQEQPNLRSRIARLIASERPWSRNEIEAILAETRAIGGLVLAQATAREHAQRAIEQADALPQSKYKDALVELARFAAIRGA